MPASLWLRQLPYRLFPRCAVRRALSRRRVRPYLEVLEDRLVPAPVVTEQVIHSFGGLTVVTLDGVLPVSVSARTPQGQFLGAVAVTLSAEGTLVVKSINAQGQVVSAQPL